MEQQAPMMANILPFMVLMIVFYFIVILPNKKKEKEHKEMVSKLEKNDKVVTFSGIHGVIVSVTDDTVVVRVDDVAKIKIDKTAIREKLA